MTKDTGGKAFPSEKPVMVNSLQAQGALERVGTEYISGMTLNDYFKAKIMQGFASQMLLKDIVSIADGTMGGKYYIGAAEELANAMIAERNKP